ncbi:MAG: hypothetical protein ACP5HQ_03120 [Thermoprotei archaeon]
MYVATNGKGGCAYFARVVLVNNATVAIRIPLTLTSSLVDSVGNSEWSVYAMSPQAGEIDVADPRRTYLSGKIELDFKGLTVTHSGPVKPAQGVAESA